MTPPPIGNLRRDESGVWFIRIASGYVECPDAHKDTIQTLVEMWYKFEHAAVRSHILKLLRARRFDHDLAVY